MIPQIARIYTNSHDLKFSFVTLHQLNAYITHNMTTFCMAHLLDSYNHILISIDIKKEINHCTPKRINNR